MNDDSRPNLRLTLTFNETAREIWPSESAGAFIWLDLQSPRNQKRGETGLRPMKSNLTYLLVVRVGMVTRVTVEL